MSYSMKTNEKGRYDIFEKETETTIALNRQSEKDVRDICRKLNLGSGFNGWTPTFFAEKLDIH